jgi:FkbM family methyltransferase
MIIKINSFLNLFGVHLKRIVRNHDTVINDIIAKTAIPEMNLNIIDCGAHNGSSIERFRKIYGTGANIFAFEPSDLHADLIERFEDDKTKICNIALSDRNALIDFYQHNSSTGSSSVEKVDTGSNFSVRRGLNNPDNVSKIKVTSMTLDKFSKENNINHIHHLKVDVQGHEENVLKGSEFLLSKQNIDVIEIEVIVGQAYETSASIYDIEKHLIPKGYKLVSLSPDGRFYNMEPHDIFKNPELQFDLIYCSEKIYKSITS